MKILVVGGVAGGASANARKIPAKRPFQNGSAASILRSNGMSSCLSTIYTGAASAAPVLFLGLNQRENPRTGGRSSVLPAQ